MITFSEDYIKDIIIELLRDEYPKLLSKIKDFIEDEVLKLLRGYNQSEEQLKADIREIIFLTAYNYLEKEDISDIVKMDIIGTSKYKQSKFQSIAIFRISQKIKMKYTPKYLDLTRKRHKQKYKNNSIQKNLQANINLIGKINNSLFKLQHFKHKSFNCGEKYIEECIKAYPKLTKPKEITYINFRKDRLRRNELKKTISTSISKLTENEKYLTKKAAKRFMSELEEIKKFVKTIEVKQKERKYKFISITKVKEYLKDILKNKILNEKQIDTYINSAVKRKILLRFTP